MVFLGEYELLFLVEFGFVFWVNWVYFFNMFLIVLIICFGF